jgi:antirestriction protein
MKGGAMNEEQRPKSGGGQDHQTEETPELEPSVVPRIYVASLSDYNAGRLYGRWLNAAVETDQLVEGVRAMLAASPEPIAEEWAIHDYEGFGPLRLSEYESLGIVSQVALGIAEHGPAFAHWASLIGTNDEEALSRFEDAYLGQWDRLTEYAEELLDDIGVFVGIDESLPDHLQPYVTVDVEGFARDMELGGQITTSTGEDGIYIFDGGL